MCASGPQPGQSAPAPVGQSTHEAGEQMSTTIMEPAPGLEPLGEDPTRDELLTLWSARPRRSPGVWPGRGTSPTANDTKVQT